MNFSAQTLRSARPARVLQRSQTRKIKGDASIYRGIVHGGEVDAWGHVRAFARKGTMAAASEAAHPSPSAALRISGK